MTISKVLTSFFTTIFALFLICSFFAFAGESKMPNTQMNTLYVAADKGGKSLPLAVFEIVGDDIILLDT